MPFVYFHRSDGYCYHHDRIGRYVASESQVLEEAKQILVKDLIACPTTSDTFGLSVKAQDISGRTIFQVSVIAAVW
ncbi:DUF6894 family protein [Pararhizobium arenae]|uniref:DUF6894 family protein n=1 Tax=Pararhizobium arenae TaxID=1856850 RepID=UPI00094AA2C1